MRTEEEKQRQIEGLKKEKESLPEHNFFGDNNWKAIDAMISILTGENSYEDYEDDEPNVEQEAYRCKNWLDGDENDDLFEKK